MPWVRREKQGTEARKLWGELSKDHPDLYAPLNPEHAQEQTEEAPAHAPEPRTLEQARAAMRQLDLPEYAEAKHGYRVEWHNDKHTLAELTKEDEALRASKGQDGAWTYRSRTGNDRGDILDFEIHRGARTLANAREEVRPELDRVEKERGHQLNQQPERAGPERGRARGDDDNGMERGLERGGPSGDGDDGPDLDPDRPRRRP